MKETLELLRQARERLAVAEERGDRFAASELRQAIEALELVLNHKAHRPSRRVKPDRDE